MWMLPVTLTACENPPPPVVPARTVATPAAAPPPPIEAARVEELAPSGCEVESEALPKEAPPLRLFATLSDVGRGQLWVTARSEVARFRLPVGDGSVAAAELDGFGTSVSGLVDFAKLPLWMRASRPLAGGLITADRETRVELVRVESDGVVVRLARHELIDTAALPIEERLRCADLSASPQVAPPPSAGKEIRLVAKDGLEVSPTPDRDDKAGLTIKPVVGATLEAIELERASGFVRVEVPSRAGRITGWVPAAAVRPPVAPAHGVLGVLSSSRSPNRDAAPELIPKNARRCRTNLRLASESWQGPVWLGAVRAGVALLTEDRKAPAGWVAITVRGVSGQLLARTTDLADAHCEE